MLIEPVPIDIYVAARFKDKLILGIIENWRVEPEVLEKQIVTYFKEMGIFAVAPNMDLDIKEAITALLIHSPEIFSKVRKAEHQELMRRQSRRNDR